MTFKADELLAGRLVMPVGHKGHREQIANGRVWEVWGDGIRSTI